MKTGERSLGFFFLTPYRGICGTVFHIFFSPPHQNIPLFQIPSQNNKLLVRLRLKSEKVNYTRTQNSSGTEGDLQEPDSSKQVCIKRYSKEFDTQKATSVYPVSQVKSFSKFPFSYFVRVTYRRWHYFKDIFKQYTTSFKLQKLSNYWASCHHFLASCYVAISGLKGYLIKVVLPQAEHKTR